jgi:hypothetical protein
MDLLLPEKNHPGVEGDSMLAYLIVSQEPGRAFLEYA